MSLGLTNFDGNQKQFSENIDNVVNKKWYQFLKVKENGKIEKLSLWQLIFEKFQGIKGSINKKLVEECVVNVLKYGSQSGFIDYKNKNDLDAITKLVNKLGLCTINKKGCFYNRFKKSNEIKHKDLSSVYKNILMKKIKVKNLNKVENNFLLEQDSVKKLLTPNEKKIENVIFKCSKNNEKTKKIDKNFTSSFVLKIVKNFSEVYEFDEKNDLDKLEENDIQTKWSDFLTSFKNEILEIYSSESFILDKIKIIDEKKIEFIQIFQPHKILSLDLSEMPNLQPIAELDQLLHDLNIKLRNELLTQESDSKTNESLKLFKEKIFGLSASTSQILDKIKILEEQKREFNHFFQPHKILNVNVEQPQLKEIIAVDQKFKELKEKLINDLLIEEMKTPLNDFTIENLSDWTIEKFIYLNAACESMPAVENIRRFGVIKEMAKYGLDMHLDGFKLDFIKNIIDARLELKKSKVLNYLPEELILKSSQNINSGEIECYYKNENVNKITSYNLDKLSDCFYKFVHEKITGVKLESYILYDKLETDFLVNWGNEQGNGSWLSFSKTMKNWLLSKQIIPEENSRQFLNNKIYTCKGHIYSDNEFSPNKEKMLYYWIAMQMEFLTSVKMTGADQNSRLLTVQRTEGDYIIPENGNNIEKNTRMYSKRGPLESFSLGDYISAQAGNHLVTQTIPFHRVFAMWFFSGKGKAGTFFLHPNETEILCMPTQTSFVYEGKGITKKK